ncbi:hypothetical protein FKW77_010184, partial [Venturia effusa]
MFEDNAFRYKISGYLGNEYFNIVTYSYVLVYFASLKAESSRLYYNNGSKDVRRSEYEEKVGYEEREEIYFD